MEPDRSVSLAQAKATLSELVSGVECGETVVITKRGHPAAELRAPRQVLQAIDVGTLQAITDQMTEQEETAEVAVRRMRDEARY